MKPELNQTQAIYPPHGPKPKMCVTTAIERYFWNGLSRERLKAMKALYALRARKALNALYAKYANVFVGKRTLVEKSEILNLRPNCIYSMQSIEQHLLLKYPLVIKDSSCSH